MRSAMTLVLLVTAAVSFGHDSAAAAGEAAQLYPIDLRISGDESGWFPENSFSLSWDRPPVADQGFPVTAIDFRVRNSLGGVVVPDTRLPWDATTIDGILVPPLPGVYTAEVWLEGPGGARGPEVSVQLRFDDTPPGTARPLSPAGWIAGGAAAIVAIQHPPEPQPPSGIRGYAVVVDRSGERAPCAVPDRCGVAETDLRGGIGDDTVTLGTLPEGINVVSAVAVSGAGVSSAEVGRGIVRVDATRPETVLAGIPHGWSNGPVRLIAKSADSLSGMGATGPGGAYTAIAIDGSAPRAEPGDSVAVVVAGEGTHSVVFYARDAAGNVGDRPPPAATVSIDESPPRVAFARVQDPAEPERIEATVADSLSGADPRRGSIAVRRAGTSRRWTLLPTTATAGRLLATWDSGSEVAGAYEFRASGYDRAGNSAVSNRRGGGVKMVLVNPLKAPVQVQAGLSPSAAEAVAYGRGLSYSGRLTSPSGHSLSGLPVEIVETFDPDAAPSRRARTVLTGSGGRFFASLQAGPSRRVEASFAGTRTLGRALGGEARLRVRASLRMRVSARVARIGGAPVVFSGRVGSRGAVLPAGGLPVELQFRSPGRSWAEFRTVQTDAHGRFRYPYAFSDDDSGGVRFQFRAYMTGGGWPYEPAASDSVAVTGR